MATVVRVSPSHPSAKSTISTIYSISEARHISGVAQHYTCSPVPGCTSPDSDPEDPPIGSSLVVFAASSTQFGKTKHQCIVQPLRVLTCSPHQLSTTTATTPHKRIARRRHNLLHHNWCAYLILVDKQSLSYLDVYVRGAGVQPAEATPSGHRTLARQLCRIIGIAKLSTPKELDPEKAMIR